MNKIEADKENLSYGTKEETWKGQIRVLTATVKDKVKRIMIVKKTCYSVLSVKKNPSEMHNRENIQLLPQKIFREEKQ